MKIRIAKPRITNAITIQVMAQKKAGIPVALAMFAASVEMAGPNGDERKKTVFKSSRAFSTHWTARKLTKKVATLGPANLANAIRPTDRSVPASNVKGIPESAPPVTMGVKIP